MKISVVDHSTKKKKYKKNDLLQFLFSNSLSKTKENDCITRILILENLIIRKILSNGSENFKKIGVFVMNLPENL